mgnify:FL=1
MTVGHNASNLHANAKRRAYACDITYTSNAEIGFDYLRDNMVSSKEERVMRGLNYAIIDEIDSVLIDDAMTPLIISSAGNDKSLMCINADRAVKALIIDDDYIINLREHNVNLTEQGIHKIEKIFGIKNLYDLDNSEIAHHIEQALKANYIMICNTDYIVDYENQEILIVDPNTGRTMKGRQWSQGLHQAIEAKEGVEIKQESNTIASITYQNFFRLYNKLSGMSGTAKIEEEEFLKTYNMFVIQVPPNKPVIRKDYPDVVFSSKNAKYEAIVNKVEKLHQKGQPVLVGTVSVETSELLSEMMVKRGIPHSVLNAKNNEKESMIISRAGEEGAVTIATNMAGRGTDIKLGEGVKELGGLAVIGTERHKSNRIDDQLRGRSGRQGDPGFSRFYVSTQDELIVQYGSENLEGIIAKLNDGKNESKVIFDAINNAQKRAEGISYDIRKTLLEYDDVLRTQRETIYEMRNHILDYENIHLYIKDIFVRAVDHIITKVIEENNTFNKVITDKNIIYTKTSMAIAKELNKLPKQPIFDYGEFMGMEKRKAVIYVAHTFFNLYEIEIHSVENLILPIERKLALLIIDNSWMEHISMMDELRQGIGLRSYAQNNPLQEYITQGYDLFEKMMKTIEKTIMERLLNLTIEYER